MRGLWIVGVMLTASTARAAEPCVTLAAPAGGARVERSGQARARVLFVNYDGATLTQGAEDDARADTTMYAEFAGSYAGYGAGGKREASLQAVRADFAAYAVTITDARPTDGDYTMCVVSPSNPFGDGVLGAAPLDCEDEVANNVVLAFHGADDAAAAAAQATTISQELAHAYGLEHVNDPRDVMNPAVVGVDAGFGDECVAIVSAGAPLGCAGQHRRFCEAGQRAHQELLWLFGPAEPDTTPPTVSITSPLAGEVVTAPVTIVAAASDELGVAAVTLRVDGAALDGPDAPAPYRWIDRPLAAGERCATAEARDHGANVAGSAEVCFTVTPAAAAETGEESGGSEASGSGDPQEEEEGCGCAAGGRRGIAGWLVVLGAVRRRGRRA